MDFQTLELLRQNHPAWRLLASPHAPLIAGFLQRAFVAPNQRLIAQADLAEALEDELFGLRERLGNDAFPKPGLEPVAELKPDARIRRLHYNWLENRRIMEILHGIEAKALSLRENQPAGEVMAIAEASADIELPSSGIRRRRQLLKQRSRKAWGM